MRKDLSRRNLVFPLVPYLGAFLIVFSVQGTEASDNYAVSIEPRLERIAAVEISLDFVGDSTGTTSLELPREWGGEDELWRSLVDFEFRGGTLARSENPDLLIAHHPPGADLRLTYRIVPDRRGLPSADVGDYYRPVVTADTVHLIGHTVFVRPVRAEDAPVRVSLNGAPGWEPRSDLEHGVESFDALQNSVIVAGRFEMVTLSLPDAPLRIAVHRDALVDTAIFAAKARQAAEGNLAYWSEAAFPYLISVLPVRAGPGRSSLGGTNLHDAFAFFTTPRPDLTMLSRMLTHEYAHSWVPTRLGGAYPGSEEAMGYWFSEGFTDFLTQRAGLIGGLWDAATSIAMWNDVLAEYAASPLRSAENEAIARDFWSSTDAQRIPYLRGMLFAALVERHIRDATEGAQDLDDVFLAMRSGPANQAAPARLASAVLGVTGIDITGLLQSHIIDGEPIELPPDSFAPCGAVEVFEEPVFVYGMQVERDAQGHFRIIAVDQDGPAWKSGFREGMLLLERTGGAYGDATQDSVFQVLVGEEEQEMRYRPSNGDTVQRQRIVVAEEDLDGNGCAVFLAGGAGPIATM